MNNPYDVIVIGGGAAGLAAALFSVRYGHPTLLLERMMTGGQIVNCEKIENYPGIPIENYPGIPEGISGAEFGPLMAEQAVNAGVDVRSAEVLGLTVDGLEKRVTTDGGDYAARALIIAGGSSLRTLGIAGEERLRGRGVSTCATCDGPFFADQAVGVVGGGDSAADEALTLTGFASEVIVFHRRETLTAQRVLQDRLLSHPKVRVRWSTVVEEVLGADEVSGVRVREIATGYTSDVALAGLFVLVGLEPNTSWLADALDLDAAGHVPTDIWMRTAVPGVFAAGDIRQNSAAQVITAAGDGATAAMAAHRYIVSP